MSSYFFDNVDYYSDVLSDPIGEFNAIVPKIRDDFVSYKKGLFLSDRSHDVRFKDKMHGHTAYSWKAFCLKPRDSKIERFAGSFFLALLPIANVTDIVINIGILGKETLKSLDNLIMKTTSVVLRLFPVLKDKASFNAHKTHALNSFFYTMLSTGLLFMEIPLVPLYWIGLCPIRLNHSYYLFDKEKNEYVLVLDQNKVAWLKDKFGYHRSHPQLTNIDKPYRPAKIEFNQGQLAVRNGGGADNFKFECSLEEGSTEKFTLNLTWIFWSYVCAVPFNSAQSIYRAHKSALSKTIDV